MTGTASSSKANRPVRRSRGCWAGATVVTILPDSGERYLSIWDTLETETQ